MDQNHDMDEEKLKICFREIAPAIEFACWVVALLAPLLRLVNGAAVTDDQFVIQVIIFFMAVVGGVGLRVYQTLLR